MRYAKGMGGYAGWMQGASSVAMILAVIAGSNAYAQDSQDMETVVVTGFRASLEKALDNKRNSLNATDAIYAEDIAKFPDLNVSDALQRIPGVALNRSAGEGNQVTVRGLTPEFTRVRINGMEALSTAGSSTMATINRGRAFDFNVFASDLFSQLVVQKSNSAEIEEGSLGATVDMQSGHPFDHSGLVVSANAKMGYNSLAGTMNPRVSALVSNTFLGGRLGVLVSAAYAIRNVDESGWSSVGWANDNTVQTASHAAPAISGCSTSASCLTGQRVASVNGATSGTDFDAFNEGYKARMPRYDMVTTHIKRLGLTGSVQWEPESHTRVTLDGLFADYDATRHEYYLESTALSTNFATKALGGTGTPVSWGIGKVAVTSYTLNSATNNVTQLTANNMGQRAEHFLTYIDSRFMQATLNASHEFSEQFKVHTLFGWSESHMRQPIETTVTYDYGSPGAQGYSYDFSGSISAVPALKYGSVANADGSVTNTSGWFLSQLREKAEGNFDSYRTITGDFEYAAFPWLKVKGGVDWKLFGYNTVALRRTNGSTASQDYVIPADMRAADLSKYTSTVSLKGLSPAAGSATTWLVPDIGKWNGDFHIWDPTVESGAFRFGTEPALSQNGTVHEEDLGFWLQADWDTTFYGVPFRGNIGGRYVETTSEAVGYTYNPSTGAGVPADVSQTYHDFLPALNMVFAPTETFDIRIGAAYGMARPSLTNMLPGAAVTVVGATRSVTVGNPNLKPFRSKNIDVAYEWYYHKGSMLSVAFFYKHIDSLVQTLRSSLVFNGNSFGLANSLAQAACGTTYIAPPASGCNENAAWIFQASANTKGSPLYGTEINWQQQFDFLPGRFENMGVLANLTLVQARQDYFNTDGSVYTTADLSGLSRTSYNATLYYDDSVFQIRGSAAFRSKYLAGVNPGYWNDQQIMNGTLVVDAAASYKVDDNFTVTFDALNLTNQAISQYYDTIGKRVLNWHQTGSEYYIGLRYNY